MSANEETPAVRKRIAEIHDLVAPGAPQSVAQAHRAHATHRRNMDEDGVVLYAGTNATRDQIAGHHDVQLGMRPSMGRPGDKAQAGLESVEVLERFASTAVAATVSAAHADVRLPSGTLANLAVYSGLLDVGATIAVLPAWAGGHVSHHAEGAAGLRGLKTVELPFDAARQDVDLERLEEVLAHHQPGLVVVGGCLPLFPYRLAELAAVVHAAGALLLYDASHTVGLIAGQQHQRPFQEGSDVVTFSTYKSFGGPAGGVVACVDPEVARRVDKAVYPRLTANYDAGRLLPLGLAAHHLLDSGADYARSCVESARALAVECDRVGLPPLARARGFTATHVLAIRQADREAAHAAMTALAGAGIFTSPALACDEDGTTWVLRFGVQELVRRGFAPSDMAPLAQLVGRVLVDGEPPELVRPAVAAFRRADPTINNERTGTA